MKKQDILQRVSDLKDEMRSIMDAAEAEKRHTLNEDEQKRYDALLREGDELKRSLENLKGLEGLDGLGDVPTKIGQGVAMRDSKAPMKDDVQTFKRRYRVSNVVRSLVDPSYKLEGIEREGHEEATREFSELGKTAKGVAIPSFFMSKQPTTPEEARAIIDSDSSDFVKKVVGTGEQRRDLVVGTDTAGGHAKPTFTQPVIEYLRPDLVLERAGARMLTGLTGDVKYPRQDSVPSIAWEGETDSTAEIEGTLDQFTLAPKRAAGFTDVSRQLIIQAASTMMAEEFARRDLVSAVEQGVEIVAMNGGSTNEPTGIIQTAGIGDVAIAANGGAPTWPKMVEFVTDLASSNAYKGRLAFLFTPEVAGQMMTIQRATNTERFILAEPGTSLLGRPVFWTNNLPKTLTKGTGTGLHAAIFGNFDELLIAQFGGLDLVVDEMSQAVPGLVRLVVNTFWDVGLRHPGSFSACLDLDPTA